MNNLQTKHRAIGGPLDGDPIYDDRWPQVGDEKLHDTDKCEHVYKFDGRVWRHERVVILRPMGRRVHDDCGGGE